MPFRHLELNPEILKAINELGYTEPTPIQKKAIPSILKGHDVIGIAQTGTGKTAAFVLPILHRLMAEPAVAGTRKMRVLVLTPTRELAGQIEENVRAYARHLPIRMAVVYGGVGEQPQIAALRNSIDIVVATPGRLLDLYGQGKVDFSRVTTVVLDEADRMLDMGFLPDMKRIIALLPVNRQTLLFSASLSPEIEKVTSTFQRNAEIVQVGRRANPAESVTQLVYEAEKDAKIALLLHLLNDQSLDAVLVFSRTKHGADKIARKLMSRGITTATLHSNRSQSQRLQALKSFKSGEVRVLVATDIAARGIDVVGISHVINFDFPPAPEDYVHRIGRTGRASAVGDAISFVSRDEMPSLRALERFIGRGIARKTAEGFDARAAIVDSRRDPEPSRAIRPPYRGAQPARPSGGNRFAQPRAPQSRSSADTPAFRAAHRAQDSRSTVVPMSRPSLRNGSSSAPRKSGGSR